MPKETESEFDSNGFFHTGDIGLLTPGGALKIIDRKKNMVKLKVSPLVSVRLQLVQGDVVYLCLPSETRHACAGW